MKKILLSLIVFVGLLSPTLSHAQFTVESDTIFANVTTTATIHNDINDTTSNAETLKWHVVASSFPSDWLSGLGICDNSLCRYNSSGDIWNGTSGTTYTSSYLPGSAEFALSVDFTAASNGTHYISVAINDQAALYTKIITFVITRASTAVPTVNSNDNITLYPNPARNDVNVVYAADADVKSIAVYNMIGKAMTAYKVTDNTSANLNIQSIPSGIYFVRLFNSEGNVVATRKFTKQ